MTRVQRIAVKVGVRFPCFGGGEIRTQNNPLAFALRNDPLQFAAGVDVTEVVKFVLAEQKKECRKSKSV